MDKVKIKETILTISLGFIALYLVFDRIWLLYIAFGVGLSGLVSNRLSAWIHTAWFNLADIMGYIMSRIILGSLFYVILVPVGALAKLFRKDFMYLEKRDGSYYFERNHSYKSEDFTNPW